MISSVSPQFGSTFGYSNITITGLNFVPAGFSGEIVTSATNININTNQYMRSRPLTGRYLLIMCCACQQLGLTALPLSARFRLVQEMRPLLLALAPK